MIPLTRSSFVNEQETKAALIAFIQSSDRFSYGPQCQLFEEQFSKKQQRAHSLFVSSGSAANLCLIQALLNTGQLKKGDQVGVSAITWATNVMPLIQLGLAPVVIDCELETLNVSVRTLQGTKMRALFLTNVLGLCDNISTLQSYCADHDILLLEDNCEALGTRCDSTLLGNFGVASTFSFFVGHHLSTIEGGMVCTDNTELYEACVMIQAHGWDRNLPADAQTKLRTTHHVDDFFAKYTFWDLAYNLRPTEIQGCIGTTQLKHWDMVCEKRDKQFRIFHSLIQQNSDFIPLNPNHIELISNFAMPVVCRNEKILDTYKKRFTEKGVEIRPIISGNITRQPFYKKYITDDRHYPNADIIHTQGFYFPNHAELADDEIQLLRSLLTP